ncbi:MAG: ion transporter [Candidatus Kapabacteria bacterium]|nr:ion transporter [Candidatus Kapabacteria bacterium]
MARKTWLNDLRVAVNAQSSNPLDTIVIGLIFVSAIIVGLETSSTVTGAVPGLFEWLDRLIVVAFGLEIIIKVAFRWPRPMDYFKDPWHMFDVTIFVLTILPLFVSDDQGAVGSALALRSIRLVRSFRALRVMRLASEFKGVRIVIETLLRSIPQLTVVAILLACIVYTYAVIGYNLFHTIDQANFGSLGSSLLAMSQCAVGDFADLMHTQMNGPDGYPILSPLFFLSFVLIASLTILNFFVGTILSELESVRDEESEQTTDIQQMQEQLREMRETLARIEKQGM